MDNRLKLVRIKWIHGDNNPNIKGFNVRCIQSKIQLPCSFKISILGYDMGKGIHLVIKEICMLGLQTIIILR